MLPFLCGSEVLFGSSGVSQLAALLILHPRINTVTLPPERAFKNLTGEVLTAESVGGRDPEGSAELKRKSPFPAQHLRCHHENCFWLNLDTALVVQRNDSGFKCLLSVVVQRGFSRRAAQTLRVPRRKKFNDLFPSATCPNVSLVNMQIVSFS